MPEEVVLEFVELLENEGIEVILDGGWAVDALLGYQSRSHEDLVPHEGILGEEGVVRQTKAVELLIGE